LKQFFLKLLGYNQNKNQILNANGGGEPDIQPPTFQEMVTGLVLGSCVGDALGVPVEFHTRASLDQRPVRDMREYGTWNQPAGTWSDDSSMLLCTTEALIEGCDIKRIAGRFILWYQESYWTPHGEVFDIGNTTKIALDRIVCGDAGPENSGLSDEYSNGNGSLMRILPLAFHVVHLPFSERAKAVRAVSAITHAHERSVLACIILVEFACFLIMGRTCDESYKLTQEVMKKQFAGSLELTRFPLIFTDIRERKRENINSGGYVIETVEAAIWSLLKHRNYVGTVLEAVNLGGDTDTTAIVAGGLAGLAFGSKGIPSEWVRQLAKTEQIQALADKFTGSLVELRS
jgi:ADP-ribosyl-[dinitrogen reductase] hydrolase